MSADWCVPLNGHNADRYQKIRTTSLSLPSLTFRYDKMRIDYLLMGTVAYIYLVGLIMTFVTADFEPYRSF